jgi:RHS repeat-associated protein
LIGQGSQTSSYDALDRPTAIGATSLAYAGVSDEVVSDGTQQYGRGPGDEVLAVAQGETKRLVITDQHGDVTGGFDPADQTLAALPDSRTYDPFGQTMAGGGLAYGVGYQGDWTNPATKQVNMGARWYDPATSTFTSRDAVDWPAGTASPFTNPYAYGAANPLTYSDPDGRSPIDRECERKWEYVWVGDGHQWRWVTVCHNVPGRPGGGGGHDPKPDKPKPGKPDKPKPPKPEKMSQEIDGVEIHYVRNLRTGEVDDYKFKDWDGGH